MRTDRIDAILGLIDGVLPPEELIPSEEVSGLVAPQFELIVALSGVEAVTANRGFDSHHLFWPRSDYRTRTEKIFRRQFIIPINRGIHEEIHAQIEPPVKPSREVMIGYLTMLDVKDHGQQAAVKA